MQKKFLNFCRLLIFFYFLLFSYNLNAQIILIKGNINISENTINSFISKNLDINNPEDLNALQKKLFSTGFFENINLSVKNNNLTISVIENPLVNYIFLEGIQSQNLLKNLEKIILIKENSFFQKHLLRDSLNKINTLLKTLGYFNGEVNSTMKKIDNNKLNIFFDINLNEQFKINRIYFIGDKKFNSSELMDVVYAEEHGWWKFLSKSTIPSESVINYDINNLKNFYLNNGYYDVQIISHSIELLSKNRANIVYSINSGDRFLIDKVNLIDKDNSLNKQVYNTLKKIINTYNLKFYSQSSVDKLVAKIENFLSEKNYNLKVNFNLKKIENRKLFLDIFLTEDKIKKLISKIFITGNSITDDKFIRNNLLIAEGDYFQINKIDKSIKEIKNTRIFEDVSYIANNNNENIDIEIKVTEKPTGEMSAGAGFGNSGASFVTVLNESNFLGKGIDLNSTLNIGTEKIFGRIDYNNPFFNDSDKSLRFSIFAESNDFENAGYESKIVGTTISTSYEIYDDIFFKPGFGFDTNSVNTSSIANDLIKSREGDFFTTKVYYDINLDKRDTKYKTKEGFTFGFGQQLSLFYLSEIPSINNKIYGSYFNEIAKGFVGSIRYKFEATNAFDDNVKFSDRLFVTDQNLRGFSSRGIGPKLSNEFIGGNYSYFGTLATTVPNGLPDKWNAQTSLFLDTANVWGVDYTDEIDNSNKLRSSVGIGISWVSPMGPISLSYAQPLSKASSDDIEQFSFRIGSVF